MLFGKVQSSKQSSGGDGSDEMGRTNGDIPPRLERLYRSRLARHRNGTAGSWGGRTARMERFVGAVPTARQIGFDFG